MLLQERELVVDGRRFHLTVCLTSDLPSTDHVSTAHCLGFGVDGRFLLARHVGRGWTIPGGHIEPGESPDTAMRREAMEEAAATIGDAVVVATERVDLIEGAANPRYPQPSYQVFFLALVERLDVLVPNEECTESRLFPVSEALRLPGWPKLNGDLFDAGVEMARRRWSLPVT